jgi:hypothetical protein
VLYRAVLGEKPAFVVLVEWAPLSNRCCVLLGVRDWCVMMNGLACGIRVTRWPSCLK